MSEIQLVVLLIRLILLLEGEASSQVSLVIISIVGFLSLIVTSILAPLAIARNQRKILEQNRAWDLEDRKKVKEEVVKVAASATVVDEKLTVLLTVLDKKADSLVVKTEQIHVLTNSNMTELKSQLAVALSRVDDMQETIDSLVHKLPAVVSPVPLARIDRIEAKTEQIDMTTHDIKDSLTGAK